MPSIAEAIAVSTLMRCLPCDWPFWTAAQDRRRQVPCLYAHRFVVHDRLNGYISAAIGTELLSHGDPNGKSTRGKNALYRVKFVVGTE